MSILSKLAYWLTIRPRLNGLRKLLPEAVIHPTGSRYVCEPPVFNTDIDFLVYVDDTSITSVEVRLIASGYIKTPFRAYVGSSINVEDFNAWRRGPVNLVVTTSLKYAEAFHTATYICKLYNIRIKWWRGAIHEALRGNWIAIYQNNTFSYPPLNEVVPLLNSFVGPYGHALQKAYRVKHGLGGFLDDVQ